MSDSRFRDSSSWHTLCACRVYLVMLMWSAPHMKMEERRGRGIRLASFKNSRTPCQEYRGDDLKIVGVINGSESMNNEEKGGKWERWGNRVFCVLEAEVDYVFLKRESIRCLFHFGSLAASCQAVLFLYFTGGFPKLARWKYLNSSARNRSQIIVFSCLFYTILEEVFVN